MKLWYISQSVNNGYDTYGSAVVVAATEEEARHIHPMGLNTKWSDGCWRRHYDGCPPGAVGNFWANPEDVNVEYIGETHLPKSVVISDFLSG